MPQNVSNVQSNGNTTINQIAASGNSTVTINQEPEFPRSITLLPKQNPYFQPRKKYTSQILRTLIKTKKENLQGVAVLHGSGGSGKTSLAHRFLQHTAKNFPVRIRINAETIDTLKTDFLRLANQLKVNDAKDKTLEELVDITNGLLEKHFNSGVILYDNLPDAKDKYNDNISETVGQTIKRFFPHDKFYIIITTRSSRDWHNNSKISIDAFGQQEAINLLNEISGRTFADNQDFQRLQNFLDEDIGYLPLVICQIGSYLKEHDDIDLQTYIQKYKTSVSAIKALEESQLVTDFVADGGMTNEHRQSVLTTFNLELEQLNAENSDFMPLLDHAALMNPDDIGESELKEIYNKMNFENVQYSAFRQALKKTGLARFEKDRSYNVILMHRITQFVLLLKIHENTDFIRNAISLLLTNFSKNYLNSRISYSNFRYVLRKIQQQKNIYSQIALSERVVIDSLFTVGKAYIDGNEINSGVGFISLALKHINKKENEALYVEIKDKIIEVFGNPTYNLKHLDSNWLSDLLANIDSECRSAIIDVFFEREQKFTQRRDKFDSGQHYHKSLISLSKAIIRAFQNIDADDLTDNEQRQWTRAHYILGRTYCEIAKGNSTQLVRSRGIDEYRKWADSKRRTINRHKKWWTKPLEKLKSELGNYEENINRLKQAESDLEEYTQLAKKFLLKTIKNAGVSTPDALQVLIAEIQLLRLHKANTAYKHDADIGVDTKTIANHILKNSEKLPDKSYKDDLCYCKELTLQPTGINRNQSCLSRASMFSQQRSTGSKQKVKRGVKRKCESRSNRPRKRR